jgi:hypothetical protein
MLVFPGSMLPLIVTCSGASGQLRAHRQPNCRAQIIEHRRDTPIWQSHRRQGMAIERDLIGLDRAYRMIYVALLSSVRGS